MDEMTVRQLFVLLLLLVLEGQTHAVALDIREKKLRMRGQVKWCC